MTGKIWHTLSLSRLKKELNADSHGLSTGEAQKRLIEVGPNLLTVKEGDSALKIFINQFTNLLIVILLLAITISFLLGETLDALIILVVVIFSSLLGFIQEYRSQKALAALKKMAAPLAHVWRDGKPQKIPSFEVVPGDVLILNWGDKISADGRVIEELDLEVSEAVLTGESVAVKKSACILAKADLNLAERINMVFSGTIVNRGHGKVLVVGTGMKTEFGKIANLISQVKEEKTPLEKRLTQVSRILGLGSLAVCALATALGLWRGYPFLEMLIWGVSLAVAAVPESLPAVITGSLSLGVWEMAKQKAIVRRLPAVETLGSIGVICSDKTGTLTKNEMTVREIFVNNKRVYIEGVGYQPEGGFLLEKGDYHPSSDRELHKILEIGLLCNDSQLIKKDGDWTIDGDPTEAALVVVGAKAQMFKDDWQKKFPRLEEIPFEMERKMMSTIHPGDNGYQLFCKGAPEAVLSRCQYWQKDNKLIRLTKIEKIRLLQETEKMAEGALRVLAFSYRNFKKNELNLTKKRQESQELEKDLIFVGLMGLMDPARDEAREAIKLCKEAGIKTIIITGDHALTAFAIGKQIGLFKNLNEIVSGEHLSKLSELELLKIVDKKSYSRVTPEDKLRIIRALKQKHYLVAMTGDGVNDAPALKMADIGVAMGIAGTDVAKEASDMILADDNFATIVKAIKKGREIYDNIKKYLFYLLHCNIGEILVLMGGFLLGLPPVLSAIQILWINLATDGLPALALGVDPPDKNVMKRKPTPAHKSIFSWKMAILIFVLAINIAVVLLPQFNYFLKGSGLIKAQTIVFVTLVFIEMINAYNSRSQSSLFKINPFANKWLNLAVISSLITTFLIIQIPGLGHLFKTTSLTGFEWGLALLLSFSALIFSEGTKFLLARIKTD